MPDDKCPKCHLPMFPGTVRAVSVSAVAQGPDRTFVPPEGQFCLETDNVPCLSRQLAEAKAARETAELVAADRNNRATTLTKLLDREHERCDDLRRRLLLHSQKAADEYWAWQGDGEDHLESLTCPVLIPATELRNIIAAKETAEAACAAMRKDCAWQCSSYEDGARYCDFCHQKLPDHDRCCIFADTLGQALLDRLERYREALEAIRDGCRCTCGEPRNIYCPRCDAVAALDEKEKTDAEADD